MNLFVTSIASVAIVLTSCGGSAENENPTSAEGVNYKMNIPIKMDEIITEISKPYDLKNLSYTHGVATAQQLKMEKLEFIDITVFLKAVKEFHEKTKPVPDKMVISQKIQKIAQENNGLDSLNAADKLTVEEGIAGLFYDVFINHSSFANLSWENFEKGCMEFWANGKVENEQALAESYFAYKTNFSKELSAKFLEKNKIREGVVTTVSGLQYEILKEGEGEKPLATSEVTVHYHGETVDGKVFDSSFRRGESEKITFKLNQVIPGWTEGVQLMNLGAKYRFYIPYQLAYGEQGTPGIPPFSTLIFDVELFEYK